MIFETDPVNLRQALFQIIRYQLGQFLAGQFRFRHDTFRRPARFRACAERLNLKNDFQEYHVLSTAPYGAAPSD